MAKLNRDDHKTNDIGAKIVKWGGVALLTIGSLFVGSKIHDANSNSDDKKDEDNDKDGIC